MAQTTPPDDHSHGSPLLSATAGGTTRSTAAARIPAGDVRLLDHPFLEQEASDALRRQSAGGAGAVVVFTGVVRRDDVDGHSVVGLEFEAYPEMAEAALQAVRAESLGRFPLTGLTIWHRTDRLAVGDPIVLVAAAAQHRDAAFAAAAWTMDEVKRRVPLWKRETRDDGTSAWVHAASCRCGH